jgi:hypothetical protein
MAIEDADFEAVDSALGTWQQGDVFLGSAISFVHVADLARPLSEPSKAEASLGFEKDNSLTSIGSPVPGFVVVSQTCDIVSSSKERPFVQLAALCEVDETFAKEVHGCHRPGFAFIPALSDRRLIADLDLLMTVEKNVLMALPQSDVIRGVRDDVEARAFAECLSRRFARFAFPDDFVEAVGPMQDRIKKKHDKDSTEGKTYGALREIRVSALPAWNDAAPKIEFIFVLNAAGESDHGMETIVADLVGRFRPTGVFREPTFRIVALREISAALYVATDRLDLSHLSKRSLQAGAATAETSRVRRQAQRPWLAEGISRSTWYRRRAKARQQAAQVR